MKPQSHAGLILGLLLAPFSCPGHVTAPAWSGDRGNGTYQNPILQADYSDPDAVRVGNDYWMVASSFSHVPGLPILHSTDLVNWELVNHALPRLMPKETFARPQHGKGVWAPALRYHAGKFWIYYPDPDFGLYVVTATDPRATWSAPVLVKVGKGLIDPCPLWDDDGNVWLVHGWAKSRSGINNKLTLLRLSADGQRVESDLGIIIDGDQIAGCTTLEGPKIYKRGGWYFIFAPAGGVSTGWQSVFRAKNIQGSYEHRIVLDQGKTRINGPHQGAWVDTPSGEDWFLHFQDQDAYGRVVHLQPMVWKDNWPVIGDDPDGDGKGQPFLVHKKPNIGASLQPSPGLRLTSVDGPKIAAPPTSDPFDAPKLGLQWQWQANPDATWYSLTKRPGGLRLFAQPEPRPGNIYEAPNLLLQKFPAREFTATTRLDLAAKADGDRAGLVIFGYDYAWLGWQRRAGVNVLTLGVRREAVKGEPEELTRFELPPGPVWVRVSVRDGGLCRFSYSRDGRTFAPAGDAEFKATVGRWVGAKVGLFTAGAAGASADFDFFAVEPLQP